MNKNGFSMLELMVVIAVIAILSAVAIPNAFRWVSNRRIIGAADELNAVFQGARLRAIRENADVVILMDVGTNRCDVFIDDGEGGGVARNQVRDGSEAIIDRVVLPAGVDMYNLTFAAPWCGYTDRGIPVNNNTGQLHMRNTAGLFLGIGLNIAGNPRIIQSSDGGGTWN